MVEEYLKRVRIFDKDFWELTGRNENSKRKWTVPKGKEEKKAPRDRNVCDESDEARKTTQETDRLTRYVREEKLGSGSSAQVFRAYDLFFGKRVALKQIDRAKLCSDQDRIRCKNELLISLTVSHPNIVCFWEHFQTPEHIYLVQEEMRGGDLYEWIASSGSPPLWHTKLLFRQVCQAVGYLHSQGIVHRDLKLENILLDSKRKQVKLCDFGLSSYDHRKMVSDTPGSPAYAAPELLLGEPFFMKPVDIWSLGIVLFIMFYADYPFWSTDRLLMYESILKDEPSYSSPRPPDDALDLIRSMLSKSGHKRPTIIQVLRHPFVLNFPLSKHNDANSKRKSSRKHDR